MTTPFRKKLLDDACLIGKIVLAVRGLVGFVLALTDMIMLGLQVLFFGEWWRGLFQYPWQEPPPVGLEIVTGMGMAIVFSPVIVCLILAHLQVRREARDKESLRLRDVLDALDALIHRGLPPTVNGWPLAIAAREAQASLTMPDGEEMPPGFALQEAQQFRQTAARLRARGSEQEALRYEAAAATREQVFEAWAASDPELARFLRGEPYQAQ